ncbi:MAG: dipeptidase, partial [Chloroflexi bacterium]|nr:dipeptidase [Chloroflexota bacterium]
CASNPDDFEIALTAADCRRIVAEGKHAAVPCIEGGHCINDNLGVLRQYFDLGMRYITLTHFNTNTWADASTDASRNNGLSAFGVDVVREMNRLGMVVDISHVSDKTFWDAIEITKQPIMASHSSSWSICQHPRNMKDDMLRAVATNGGVVNVNFFPGFVSEPYRLAMEKYSTEMWDEIEDVEKFASRAPVAHWSGTPEYVEEQKAEIRQRRGAKWDEGLPTLSDVVDHIEHIAKVAGIDHVGLGSDFDGIPRAPVGLEDCSKFPAITEELLRREFSEADIKKILGENTMRVMEACIGK